MKTDKVNSFSISTKRGDGGKTSLLYGLPIVKSDPKLDVCGTGDEVISALGLARAHCEDDWMRSEILEMQRLLVLVNAELITESEHLHRLRKQFHTLSAEHVQALDDLLEKLEREVTLPRAFITSGASVASASLDVARTVVRRLERLAVGLYQERGLRNPEITVWLNRLSDCLFMMARYVDRELPFETVTDTRQNELNGSYAEKPIWSFDLHYDRLATDTSSVTGRVTLKPDNDKPHAPASVVMRMELGEYAKIEGPSVIRARDGGVLSQEVVSKAKDIMRFEERDYMSEIQGENDLNFIRNEIAYHIDSTERKDKRRG